MARIKLDGFKCERCSHEWVKRGGDDPKVCPKCKSPYWNKPRSKKGFILTSSDPILSAEGEYVQKSIGE
jgi:predicted Zn-ribbon and HTH transcriptional regulator